MRRALPILGLLIAWALLLGADPACRKPNPQPTPTPCVSCPAGQHCEGYECVVDPTTPCPALGVPWCHEVVPPMTCGQCQHQPAGERCPILAPACAEPPPTPVCPAICPAGQACTDPVAGCVPTPPEPPTACTIPLNGTPVLGIYLLYPRIMDATPKITNAARCALPEVGYAGRQTCPVCDEACAQRGVCEVELMGGAAPVWTIVSTELRIADEDGWKVRIIGDGAGSLKACYPNGKACSPWQNLRCTSPGGCNQ